MRVRVDNYEVMWTRHVTQKYKSWHDGTFRFHAYNQRAQLFDLEGYKVGDEFIGSKPIIVGEYMNFDQYLVSIERQLKSETREIDPPAPSNKTLRTPKTTLTSRPRASSASHKDLPPPKGKELLTPGQKPRPRPTLYKNFRLDPLSQPFVTPLKRPHSQTSDQNDRDRQDPTAGFDDPQKQN